MLVAVTIGCCYCQPLDKEQPESKLTKSAELEPQSELLILTKNNYTDDNFLQFLFATQEEVIAVVIILPLTLLRNAAMKIREYLTAILMAVAAVAEKKKKKVL